MLNRNWIAAAVLLFACASGSTFARSVVQADADSGARGGNPGINRGQVDSGKDASQLNEGAPIVYATGNLVTGEMDFSSGGEMGLYLHRTFNNYWGGVGIFGAKWLSNFDYKLSFGTSSPTGPCYPKPGAVCITPPTGTMDLWAHLPDGRRIRYVYSSTLGFWQEVKPSPVASIVRNADGTYILINESGGSERYSASGYVLAIGNEQGLGRTFTYDANNYLQRVTHTNGRYVQLAWTGNQLTSITDPNGAVYTYTYLANQPSAGLNLLSTVTQPSANPTTISYYYESTRLL